MSFTTGETVINYDLSKSVGILFVTIAPWELKLYDNLNYLTSPDVGLTMI